MKADFRLGFYIALGFFAAAFLLMFAQYVLVRGQSRGGPGHRT